MGYLLLTGITGELGTALAERLDKKASSTLCIVRNSKKLSTHLKNFNILNADITNRESLFNYVKEIKGKVDTVVHMASARPYFSKKDIYDIIFKGSVNLYDFACAIECPKYLYFSSILAAGWMPSGMSCIDESFEPAPWRLSYFGKIKLKTEKRLIKLSESNFTKTIVLRPGNIYGPPKLSFIKFVSDLLRNHKKEFYQRCKKSVMCAPIHTQDVLDCVLMLLEKKSFTNQVYFLTGAEIITIEHLARIIAGAIGFDIEEMERLSVYERWYLLLQKKTDLLRDIIGCPSFPNFIYSNKKIRKDFGFIANRNLKESVAETALWANERNLL